MVGQADKIVRQAREEPSAPGVGRVHVSYSAVVTRTIYLVSADRASGRNRKSWDTGHFASGSPKYFQR
jgi:hypothetical protein